MFNVQVLRLSPRTLTRFTHNIFVSCSCSFAGLALFEYGFRIPFMSRKIKYFAYAHKKSAGLLLYSLIEGLRLPVITNK